MNAFDSNYVWSVCCVMIPFVSFGKHILIKVYRMLFAVLCFCSPIVFSSFSTIFYISFLLCCFFASFRFTFLFCVPVCVYIKKHWRKPVTRTQCYWKKIIWNAQQFSAQYLFKCKQPPLRFVALILICLLCSSVESSCIYTHTHTHINNYEKVKCKRIKSYNRYSDKSTSE